MSEAKRFPNEALEGLHVISLDEHTGIMEVEHSPIEKYRLVLLPDRAFSVADLLAQGMSLPAIKKLWKATYCAIGTHLGLEFDTACTDLARAYYFPSHAPGAPYVAEHLPGRPLPLESFIAQALAAEDEPAANTPHDHGSDETIVTDRDGCALDLKKWDLRHRTTCLIVGIIRSCAPGLINELGDNTDDKQHIHCPFEHEHSAPDQGGGTFVANPGRLVDGETVRVFTIHCRHAACSHRTRLDFLKALIEGRHLTFADLDASTNAAQDDAADPVAEVAKYASSWAFINAGGKTLLLNTEERDLSKALLAEADFARLHRYDYATGSNGQDGTVYYAKEFLKRPPRQTKFYKNGFCFKPGGDADPGTFNLYRGLNVTASPSGSCELFRELIFDVWARRDQDLGAWLWEYFLHLVAHPGERIRTSIAIRGSQGAGKSIVFEMMRRILGDMLLVVDNQNIVLGAFNESLVGKLGVVLEEAAFAGDRGAFQKMKNLITGTTVHVNPKHKAPFAVENYSRVFLISNEEHFVHLEHGDRRYTVVQASDAWKGSDKYDRLLDQWIKSGGAERFVWEAINHEFRTIPGTRTLVINKNFATEYATSQVSQSRDALQQAIVDLLMRGSFISMRDGTPLANSQGFYWPLHKETEVQSAQLQSHMRAVLSTLAANRVEHFTSLKRIITELAKFCGGLGQHRGKQKSVLTGQWNTSPVTRTLPPRSAALEHALAKGLITRDEHDAATGRPDDCLTASDIPGRG